MRLYCRRLLAAAALAAQAGAASAAVVLDPVPRIGAGLSVGVERFVTVPASGPAPRAAAIQGLKPLGDGSGRLFVNDTRGILYVTNRDGAAPTPYLDLRSQPIGFSNAADETQTGLMSVAFHPNFNRDPLAPGYASLYTIYSTAPSAAAPTGAGSGAVSHDNVVREWTVADPSAAAASIVGSRELLRVTQPERDHGAGTIAFNQTAARGGADYGKLYIGLGDGGGVNDPGDNAQDLGSPFGKILRIDPADPDGAGPLAYGIPADNPFVGQAGARQEVWAYGLRNPQNFSWGKDGRMYIADIGQAAIEEVDLGIAGTNYGWPAREGTFGRDADKSSLLIYDTPSDPRFTGPLAQYDHEEIANGGFSLAGIGGAFLYSGSLLPDLFGQVVVSDLVSGRLFYFSPDDALASGMPATLRELLLSFDGMPTSFSALAGTPRVDLRLGADADGELYMLTKRDGDIYRFAGDAGGAVPEPAAWALMLAGFALVGGSLRRARRATARYATV